MLDSAILFFISNKVSLNYNDLSKSQRTIQKQRKCTKKK